MRIDGFEAAKVLAQHVAAKLREADTERRAAVEKLLASGGLAAAFDRLNAFTRQVGGALAKAAERQAEWQASMRQVR